MRGAVLRRISRVDGTGRAGQTLSSKKADVVSLCAHLNYQVA